jgi:dipeptidase
MALFSCDTVVLMPDVTGGPVIFGKNTDRDRNEALATEVVQAEAREGELLCTRRPFVVRTPYTTRVMLQCRPSWMWGCEMAVNAAGVAGGNEALFSVVEPDHSSNNLTGMDILRLALEKASTASEARDSIIETIETYGQGGDCGFGEGSPFYYHNAFLVADASTAFHIETCAHHWAYKRITNGEAPQYTADLYCGSNNVAFVGIYAISNVSRLGSDFDECSASLKSRSRTQKINFIE